MKHRYVLPVLSSLFSLAACTATPQNTPSIPPTSSPTSSPSTTVASPITSSPPPASVSSPVPPSTPSSLLPPNLATIEARVDNRFLNKRGESTQIIVTAQDAQGQAINIPLPLSFRLSRPEDFSISPEGVITALKDFGFSDVLVEVQGTDLQARLNVSVSLPTSNSDGGSRNPKGDNALNTQLQLTGFSSNSVWAGTTLTLNGAHFGTDPEAITVTFAGTPAQIISVSDTTITLQVPRTSGTPEVVVTKGSQSVSSNDLTVSKIIFVNDDATGLNNGSSWDNAYARLQDGLSDAINGDEIWIASGTYKPADMNGDREATFQLVAGVNVYGGFAGTEATLGERAATGNEVLLSGDLNENDGLISNPLLPDAANREDNSYHVLVGASNVSLERLTVANGNASAAPGTNEGDANSPLFLRYTRGGGLWARGFTGMNLSQVTFRGNSASVTGGGVYASNSLIDFEECTFEYNRSMALGGGLALIGGANVTRQLTLNETVFNNNQSGDLAEYGNAGGGLYLSASALITDSRFENNRSIYAGGALAFGTTATFRNTVFSDNQAINGGGLLVEASNVNLETVLFDGNEALEPEGNESNQNRGNGGGLFILANELYNQASQVTANRIIFNQNTATSYGGALSLNYDDNNLSNSLDLTNGVFVGNQVTETADETNNYRGQGGALNLSTGGSQAVRIRYSTFSANTTPGANDVSIYDSSVGSANPVNFDGSLFYATDLPGDDSLFNATNAGLNLDSSDFVDVNTPFGAGGTAFWDQSQAGLRLQGTSAFRLLAGLSPVPTEDVVGTVRSSVQTHWGAYQGN